MTLELTPNLNDPDSFYTELLAAHQRIGALQHELAELEKDRNRLWDVVGELTGEMIELERQLALATGEVLDSQR